MLNACFVQRLDPVYSGWIFSAESHSEASNIGTRQWPIALSIFSCQSWNHTFRLSSHVRPHWPSDYTDQPLFISTSIIKVSKVTSAKASCSILCASVAAAMPSISWSAPVQPAYDLSSGLDCASVPTGPSYGRKREKIHTLHSSSYYHTIKNTLDN